MKRVTLHIDRLVLRGFRRENRDGLVEGIQQELHRLLADPQAAQQLAAGGDAARLRMGEVRIGEGATPQNVGAQVAQAISRGMKR